MSALLTAGLVASCSLTGELDDITGGTVGEGLAGGSSPTTTTTSGVGGDGGAGGTIPCTSDEACAVLTDPCNDGRCDEVTHVCVADPRPNQACTDPDLCTHSDTCNSNGECVGTPYSCASDLECVESQCDGNGGCDETLVDGTCHVAGVGDECFDADEPNPQDPCEWCAPETSTTAFTPMPTGHDCVPAECRVGTCDAGGTCVENGIAAPDTPCGQEPPPCEKWYTCDVSGNCHPNGLQPASYVCREAVGDCDIAERCTGASSACPPDAVEPEGTDCGVCRRCDASGECVPADADHDDCPLCKQCSNGNCINQPAGADLQEDCQTIDCSQYLFGAQGADCYAYASATASNGTCNADGTCNTTIPEICSGQGALVSTCPDVACVNCAQGTTHTSLPYISCYNDSQQHGCAAGWICVAGACVEDTGTCPFLYTWDGATFAFETDIYGSGGLGKPSSSGYMVPNPVDYYVLEAAPAELDGSLELRMVEERQEVNYLDYFALVTADVPEGYDVAAELYGVGTAPVPIEQALHTLGPGLVPPFGATHVQSDTDVLAEISGVDETYLVLNDDRNLDFDYQTVELDLGDLSSAPQVKLWIDARTQFPNNPDGYARKATFGARSKLEVLDAGGQWVAVPKEVAYLSPSKEARRPFVLDISNIFLTSDYRVRLTWLFKIHIDAILVDTSADVPIALRTILPESAELRYYGHSQKVGGELFEFVYGPAHLDVWPAFPGAYTRYGDVRMPLSEQDDKQVIYWSGDEIVARFPTPPSPPAGTHRRFIAQSFGYYKDIKYTLEHIVEPLPFAAMSNYPYDESVEHYPDDPDHVAYRAQYHTRVLP